MHRCRPMELEGVGSASRTYGSQPQNSNRGAGVNFPVEREVIVDWQPVFVTWGLWWWLLTLAFLVGSFVLVTYRRGVYFVVSLLLYLGLVQFLGNTPVLEYLRLHYLTVFAVIGGFLAIAIVWFNWRWHWFTSKMR